jgi:NAD(P)-dependent dehydrogenase (short-subunit alcohol dehydrogenase family)
MQLERSSRDRNTRTDRRPRLWYREWPRNVASMSAPIDPLTLFRLDGKVAIVTGASSGLGERFARVLHAVGATVVLAARRVDRLERLAGELDGSVVVAADVAEQGAREDLIAAAVERCGRVDVLVNNAGIGDKVAVEDETVEQFQRAMEVNVTAVWHLSKLCAPHMKEVGGGSIVNIASMFGHVGSTPVKEAHYCASKGAVVNLTRELALQWARSGIRVNALCPGWFPSEMTAAMEGDPASQDFVRRNSPIPRMGFAHELDGALLLLASDAGTFLTGQSVLVDGGWTAR